MENFNNKTNGAKIFSFIGFTSSLASGVFFQLASGLAPFSAYANSNAELRIGISQEFENLNPIIMTMSATTYIYAMAGRPLVGLDTSGKWVPHLVESIPSMENGQARFSPDRKKIFATWKIRENAKWGDGTQITCEDLAFTREAALHPNVSISEREVYDQVESISWKPETPKVCEFTYGKVKFNFNQLPWRILPKHLEGPIFRANKGKSEGYDKNSLYTRAPTTPGLWNGPYRITEIKMGSHVTLEPNSHFYGEAPKIQRIIVRIIQNTGTLEANLRSGTIHMISSLGLSFDQALAFEKRVAQEKSPFQVLFKPSLVYEHIDLNLDHPALKDVRVRRALVHGINREELVQSLFEGRQPVAHHKFSKIDPWFTDDPQKISIYPFSRRQAQRLLDEAGWKLNEADGLRYKDNKKLSLQFMTTAGNKTRETVQTFLQSQWRSLGIEVLIRNEPARVFFGETTRKRDFGAMAMFAWVSSPENSPRSQLSCKSIPKAENSWSGQNYTGFCNKRMDELIDLIETEFDPKKRIALAHELIGIYTRELPVISLYFRSDIAVIPKGLKNFELAGHMYSETHQVERWTF